jgi:hypothetical protein
VDEPKPKKISQNKSFISVGYKVYIREVVSMKVNKLFMAIMVIGLVGSTCYLGQQCTSCAATTDPFSMDFDGAISPLQDGWAAWDEEFDFDVDTNFGSFRAQEYGPSEDVVSGDDESDDSSDEYPAVDDWTIDENFYSDYGGSEGEELGWEDTDDHPGIPGPDENALWIVFPYSTNVRTTKLVIQKDRYAKELIIPGMDGKIEIHEEKDGTEQIYVPDWKVKARRAYHVWFAADSIGKYTVWYEVQNEKTNVVTESNKITYEVFGNLAVVVTNEAKCPGETATFRAPTAGCDNVSYQWFKGRESDPGMKIDNETKSVYIIRNVSVEDAGNYTCKVECDGNSDEDTGKLYVGRWECGEKGIGPCMCQFRPETE